MEWVRPITNLGSLTSRDYTLDNGNPAVPLHVVQIYLDSPKPEDFSARKLAFTKQAVAFSRDPFFWRRDSNLISST